MVDERGLSSSAARRLSSQQLRRSEGLFLSMYICIFFDSSIKNTWKNPWYSLMENMVIFMILWSAKLKGLLRFLVVFPRRFPITGEGGPASPSPTSSSGRRIFHLHFALPPSSFLFMRHSGREPTPENPTPSPFFSSSVFELLLVGKPPAEEVLGHGLVFVVAEEAEGSGISERL
jgi:hypothetical protein